MTEEGKKKVPEHVAKELGRLAKQAGMEKDDIATMYKAIYQEEYLNAMEGVQRYEYALMIMKGQLHARLISDAKEFIGQVIDMSSIRRIKKDEDEFLVGNMYMRIRMKEPKKPEHEDFRFADITMWRDQTGLITSLERGKWYECNLRISGEKNGMWRLSSDEATTFKPIEQVNGEAPLNNFIEAVFDRTPLNLFDDNLSQGQPSNPDYKLAVGTVLKQNRGFKEDRDFGVYTVIDESLDLDAAKDGDTAHQGMTVWASGDQAIYKKGSIIQIVGRFVKKENGDRSIDGKCINPVITTGVDNASLGPAGGISGSGGPPSDPRVAAMENKVELDDL